MKVFGISMIRNEADIIALTIRHHLDLGLDRILVLDNGSSDGTGEVLRELSKEDERVGWIYDDSPFDQSAVTTRLAREAHRQGADWILPFDADEFWWAECGGFREVLTNTQAGILRVKLINFVQARHQRESSSEALLTMTQRPVDPIGPGKYCRELIESHQNGFVEMLYPLKCISRPTAEIEIHRGNHRVTGAKGRRVECEDIVCLHAPLRSKEILDSKGERGRRLEEAGIQETRGWQIQYWGRIQSEGKMEQEWAANSYEDDCLNVYGKRHETVLDPRLRDVVAPLVLGPSKGDLSPTGHLKRSQSDGKENPLRPLFVAGCQRSGTTAFVEYINDHPKMLICSERYKYIPRQVTFDHFAFERILDYSASETNMPEEWYRELLSRKDLANLRWIGDKNPDYYKHFGRLLEQNPGARFIVLYRPLEEVAESFDARAKDPEDRWPARYDFELAIKLWNMALNSTREFVEGGHGSDVLVVGYEDFFYRNETCVPLISRFLGIGLDEQVLAKWHERSVGFEQSRRRKDDLNEEQISLIERDKDRAAEEWMLTRIEDQNRDPDVLFERSVAPLISQRPRSLSPKQRIEDLQRKLEEESRKVERLSQQNRNLNKQLQRFKRQLRELRNSEPQESGGLFQKLGSIRSRLTDR